MYAPTRAPPESISLIPGTDDHTDFIFTVTLPKRKNRSYTLKFYNVSFNGGSLSFADMNNGEWEYCLDGGSWHHLIVYGGERILEAETHAGERTLSIRATDRLSYDAAYGEFNFQLKLIRTK